MLGVLRTSTTPKFKFAFKRKPNSNSKPSSTTPLESLTSPEALRATPAPNTNPSPNSTNITIASQSNQYLTLQSLPSIHRSDITISNLDHCIVNLLPVPLSFQDMRSKSTEEHPISISAVHIRDVVDTVLLLPVIQGSVILHELRRCIVVVGCHQVGPTFSTFFLSIQ